MKNKMVKSLEIAKIKIDFKTKYFDEITEKMIELKNDENAFIAWHDEKFNQYIKEEELEYIFKDEIEAEVVEEVPTTAMLVANTEDVVEVKEEDIVDEDLLKTTLNNLSNVFSMQPADALASNEIIEPKKEIKSGLTFDHLVVKDPTVSTTFEHDPSSINVKEGPGGLNITLFDNSGIISKFPDMGRIQDIIRTTDGWDVEMLPLYDDFIVCTLYANGGATNKVFIVDYKGHFMNSLPKIFLIKGGFIDESEAIHLSDALNLINYLKGVEITQPQEDIVTSDQRMIAKRIVNYGTNLVHDRFKHNFEKLCVEKVIPFIENQILPTYPDASFAIDTFKDTNHWGLSCTPNVPYRFGESGGTCKSIIYIHADGLDKEGHLLVTPTFG